MINDLILLLGSNIGNRLEQIINADARIEKVIGQIVKRSKIYETASWGDESMPPFLNRVLKVQTSFSAQEVMKKILDIEEDMGRKRISKPALAGDRWSSRIIDIDILFYNDEIIEMPGLIIPHPFLHERRFALAPLAEIEASKIHPVFKKTSKELLDQVPDMLSVAEYIVPFAIK